MTPIPWTSSVPSSLSSAARRAGRRLGQIALGCARTHRARRDARAISLGSPSRSSIGTRLRPALARAREVPGGERHHPRLAERARTQGRLDTRGQLDRLVETATALFDVAADAPEVAERVRETELALEVADRAGVCERGTIVVMVCVDPLEPRGACLPAPVHALALDLAKEPASVAVADRTLVAGETSRSSAAYSRTVSSIVKRGSVPAVTGGGDEGGVQQVVERAVDDVRIVSRRPPRRPRACRRR